jgi:hypothetical protein
MLGHVSLFGGSRGYAKRAARHFESQLRVSEAMNDSRGVAEAQDSIIDDLSDDDCDSRTNAGWVLISQRIYELRVIQLGVGNLHTICSSIFHAHWL